mgnify:CR=1 FL=1
MSRPVLQIVFALIAIIINFAFPNIIGRMLSLIILIIICGLILDGCFKNKKKPSKLEWLIIGLTIIDTVMFIIFR